MQVEVRGERLQIGGGLEFESEAIEQTKMIQNLEKKENNKGAPKKSKKRFFSLVSVKKKKEVPDDRDPSFTRRSRRIEKEVEEGEIEP